MAMVDGKHGFPLVALFDADIIVSPSDIELGENLGFLEFIDEVRDERERVSISDSVFVEVPVVLARVEFSIFLFDKKEGRGWGVYFPGF